MSEQADADRLGSVSSLIDVHEVADLLSCSARHVHRLAATGQMPQPLQLGSLRRWPVTVIRAWIDDGCPPLDHAEEAVRAS